MVSYLIVLLLIHILFGDILLTFCSITLMTNPFIMHIAISNIYSAQLNLV